ncbi:hypothetical protein HELRODRAFT_184614, partial [Helobdella robusta]|uniref:Uncharacterized protein n=1 Tax=Helobdella robusta TaxID=6412 RepID=T1FLL2_HELRO
TAQQIKRSILKNHGTSATSNCNRHPNKAASNSSVHMIDQATTGNKKINSCCEQQLQQLQQQQCNRSLRKNPAQDQLTQDGDCEVCENDYEMQQTRSCCCNSKRCGDASCVSVDKSKKLSQQELLISSKPSLTSDEGGKNNSTLEKNSITRVCQGRKKVSFLL